MEVQGQRDQKDVEDLLDHQGSLDLQEVLGPEDFRVLLVGVENEVGETF